MGSEGSGLCINMDTQASKGNTRIQNNRQNQEHAGGGLPPGMQMGWKEVKIIKGLIILKVSTWLMCQSGKHNIFFTYLCIIFLSSFLYSYEDI